MEQNNPLVNIQGEFLNFSYESISSWYKKWLKIVIILKGLYILHKLCISWSELNSRKNIHYIVFKGEFSNKLELITNNLLYKICSLLLFLSRCHIFFPLFFLLKKMPVKLSVYKLILLLLISHHYTRQECVLI